MVSDEITTTLRQMWWFGREGGVSCGGNDGGRWS